MAVRIKGIEIDGIGPFSDFKLDFPEQKEAGKAEVHIFTGENGTGKTTLLEMLMSMFATNRSLGVKRHIYVQDTDDGIGAGFSVLFSKDGELDRGTVGISKQGNQIISYKDGTSYVSKFHLQHNDNSEPLDFCAFAYSGMKFLRQVNLLRIEDLRQNPLAEAALFNKKALSETLMQWVLNSKTKASLAEGEGEKILGDTYRKAIANIEAIVSEITGWKIEFAINVRQLSVYLNVNGMTLSFDALPDGLKSILAWIADMLMRIDRINWTADINPFERNLIVALDEIDIHLHPAWQRKILPVLQRYFPNSQFFISTHSPFVVGSVDGAWVYRLKKEGQNTVLINGEPLLSEDAKSYSMLLEEVFGVKENFGIAVEEKLTAFYSIKKQILAGEKTLNDEEFKQLVTDLSIQSIELESIIGMEMRQLKRLKTSATA